MNGLIFPLIVFIYFILVTILIINIHEHNKVIKRASILFFSLAFIAIIFYDETVLDKLLYYIIKFIYYPSYYTYIFTVLFMVLVFIYTIFNNNINYKIKVFNFGICGISLVSYIIFLILKVDLSLYGALYSGGSLVCLRLVTRGFAIWLSVILLNKYYKYFACRR